MFLQSTCPHFAFFPFSFCFLLFFLCHLYCNTAMSSPHCTKQWTHTPDTPHVHDWPFFDLSLHGDLPPSQSRCWCSQCCSHQRGTDAHGQCGHATWWFGFLIWGWARAYRSCVGMIWWSVAMRSYFDFFLILFIQIVFVKGQCDQFSFRYKLDSWRFDETNRLHSQCQINKQWVKIQRKMAAKE